MAAVTEAEELRGGTPDFTNGTMNSLDIIPEPRDEPTPSCHSATTSTGTHSRHGSMSRAFFASQTSGAMLSELALADEPMEVRPWCGKCDELRPYAVLPLHTEELDPHNGAQNKALEFRSIEMRMERLSDRVKLPLTFYHNQLKLTEIRNVKLPPGLPKSRFSKDPHRTHVAVLQRLTDDEVGALERWMIHHVKMQYIQVSVAAHAAMPREGHRYQEAMKYTTICYLLKRHAKNLLSEEEKVFLFEKLQQVPLLSELPPEFLARQAAKISVCTFLRGAEVFREQEIADGIFVLVQGLVEIQCESKSHIGDVVKPAPAVILSSDIIKQDAAGQRPFLLRPACERLRSRTVLTTVSVEDATSVAVLLYVPLEVLKAASAHFREVESRERNECVHRCFSAATRMEPAKCLKLADVFELEIYPRNHVLFQAGVVPSTETARLFLVIEGEVNIVYPTKKVTIRGRRRFDTAKEIKGKNSLLGEAVFGEPYSHSAMVSSDTAKVLSLRLADYLERFLHRSAILERRNLDTPGGSATEGSSKAGPLSRTATSLSKIAVPAEELEELPQGGSAEAVREDARVDPARVLLLERGRAERRRADLQAVKAGEWKTLRSKGDLAIKRPPRPLLRSRAAAVAAAQGTGGSSYTGTSSFLEEQSLCRPAAGQLLCNSRRRIAGREAGQSPSAPCAGSLLSSSSTTPGGFSQLSLDRRIAQCAADATRLEAVHRSHATYGFHVEDAGGDAVVLASPVLVAPSGHAVLLTCGALRPQSRKARAC